MNTINLLLVVVGIIIFILASLSGGILFRMPWLFGTIGWFIGVILVAIGLWRNEKEKKAK
jgi:hypothetical protein